MTVHVGQRYKFPDINPEPDAVVDSLVGREVEVVCIFNTGFDNDPRDIAIVQGIGPQADDNAWIFPEDLEQYAKLISH